jgi:asparagine synthase (glutamine-hydrolysing)
MSVQFGRCNFDGQPVDLVQLSEVMTILLPHGTDNANTYCKGSVGVLYGAFHTTKESRREVQPCLSDSGSIIAWDGRLDNREELANELKSHNDTDVTDLALVAAAYEHWRTDCFSKLKGDWALSIVNLAERSVVLAKDVIGTCHLYYSIDGRRVTWSTFLDPLVLLGDRCFALNEEYIAGWLSFFPLTHLTPYSDIHSVPPSSFVLIRDGRWTAKQYWSFDPTKKIRYHTDSEYEEHFRRLFKESVRRRLRSDKPIIAELSGGMDSSSIVCVADGLIAEGKAGTPRLDTLSYYNDSEPNWDERPYFEKVEQKRGRSGYHIDLNTQEMFDIDVGPDSFLATPATRLYRSQADKQSAAYMLSQENRVVLSGIGGDEVLGGVPTPLPELGDLLAGMRLRSLAHQLKVWALQSRKPWVRLFLDTVREFLPPSLTPIPQARQPAPWLRTTFVNRHRDTFLNYESRVKLFGARPSFQEAVKTLDGVQRQIECFSVPLELPYEKRYPYLDQDLLEFLFAVPREQLVRPGQRRSLMRRTLRGIVPDEVLNRRRKAFAGRAPLVAISTEWASLVRVTEHMMGEALGIIDGKSFSEALRKARYGGEVPIGALTRTLDFEFWLRNLQDRNLSTRVVARCASISLAGVCPPLPDRVA